MKSEGVKDVVTWMEAELRKQQANVDAAEKRYSPVPGIGEFYDRIREQERARLETMISWKISTEKYMKKLRHQGE